VPSDVWPLVGREDEVRAVRTALDEWCTVALVGAPGVGKSRVATEAFEAALSGGVRARRLVVSPTVVQVPYAGVASLFDGDVGAAPVPQALEILGADGRAGPGDPILWVDDAHHLDEMSAALLQQLAATQRVRLLLTLRRLPGTSGWPAAIVATLREPTSKLIEIGPLGPGDVTNLLTLVLGGRVDAKTARDLMQATQGNPLYLRELVTGSLAAGALSSRDGLWRLAGPLQPSVLLDEVIRGRLDDLSSDERAALDLVAVAGRVELPLVAGLVPPEVLEGLERTGLIAIESDLAGATVDVGHPLYGDAARRHMPKTTRMRCCAALAQGLATFNSQDQELRAAVWAFEGGLDVPADHLERAARRAVSSGDPLLAGRLAVSAFRAGGSLDAAQLASFCLSEAGQPTESEAVLREALSRAEDPGERHGLTLRLAEQWWWFGGRTQEALDLLDDTVPLLAAQRGVFAAMQGDIVTACAIGERYFAHSDPKARFVAALAYAQGLTFSDRAIEAYAVAEKAYAEATSPDFRASGDPNIHVVGMTVASLFGDSFTQAREIASFVYDVATSRPSKSPRAWASMLLGYCELYLGDVRSAIRLLGDAEALWLDMFLPGLARWPGSGLAIAQTHAGEVAEARTSLTRLDSCRSDGFGLFDPMVELARTWVALLTDGREAAEVAASGAADVASRSGAALMSVVIAHDLGRMGLLDAASKVVADLSPPTSRVSKARHRFVQAAIAGDAAGLADAGEELSAVGAHLAAAEALVQAARAHGAAGNANVAARALQRAAELARRCPGARTPWLEPAPTPLTLLSEREAEVVRAAAAGLTNRQVASRLVISERTVENHLYRACVKLGVAGRGELFDLLDEYRTPSE
jgi:DNA-binding NarL/FixJ family response regulator